jgi:hypothetical protein
VHEEGSIRTVEKPSYHWVFAFAGASGRADWVTGDEEQLMAVGEWSGNGDAVWLSIPASSPYLRSVRLIAADAADRAGLDCHEVEDFRIAVDELCHFLMTSTDYGVSVSFVIEGSCVIARGFAQGRNGATSPVIGDLSKRIVNSVADRFEIGRENDELTFSVTKQRTVVARQ